MNLRQNIQQSVSGKLICKHMEMFHYNTNRNGKEYSNLVYVLTECINHYNEYLIAPGIHLLKIKKCFKANHTALSQHF